MTTVAYPPQHRYHARAPSIAVRIPYQPAPQEVRHGQRNRLRPTADQRSDQVLRTRLAGKSLAEGEDQGDAERGNRYPARHRRQRDSHRQYREGGLPARSRPCTGDLPQSRRGRSPNGDRRRRRGMEGMVGNTLGAPRRGHAQGRRAAAGPVARPAQRRLHAQPIQERVPG